jgi:predicted RNA-binding Zn ribbon-like protein
MPSVADLELVAGDPSLDFANTIEDRLDRTPIDVLRDPSDLAAWGVRAGLLEDAPSAGRHDRAELAAALGLRRHLVSILEGRVAGRPPAADDREALARAVAQAHAAGTLVPSDDGTLHWQWDRHVLASVRHTVAHDAAELLADPRSARIGMCGGPGCGWFFLDSTKRGNRRWCSMRVCGQDAKSARRRSSAPPASGG